MKRVYKKTIGEKELIVERGQLARQADSSVLLRYGKTALLITVTSKKLETSRGFFPLIINYEEKLYSVGKIPGNYQRREGRPADSATLIARLVDRPLRPLFPEGYEDEVQVVITVLAKDNDYEPEEISVFGASLALLLAPNIPFNQPVSGVNVGLVENELSLNPKADKRILSTLELKLAGTNGDVNMVEAKANELSEKTILSAIDFGIQKINLLNQFQLEIKEAEGITSKEFIFTEDPLKVNLRSLVSSEVREKYTKLLQSETDRHERAQQMNEIVNDYASEFSEEDQPIIRQLFKEILQDEFIRLIVEEKYRVDGRKIDEIRPLASEIDLFELIHGTALFTRGETQSLATVTLGTTSDEQTFDGLEEYETKKFILHYNFPPYSVGEVGRIGAPGRREIGHGNLAEKALSVVMPTNNEFPYTIRVVSEILESNGSSSQATICAGSMALMAAGVPIKENVAGIAMGLIKKEDKFTILTDIQGLEDHLGDMDFKVAGTKNGICAIQMDIKIEGITTEILEESLEQARVGRLEILEHMNTTIKEARTELSPYAPKIATLQIEEKQIREVIGKGGEVINKIIEETDVKIDIEEDGLVKIYSTDQESIDKAKAMIEKIVKTYKIDEEYIGIVSRIEKYGAFVKFDDGVEALIHISDLAKGRVEKVEDVLKLNEKINFKIKEVDNKGRIKGKLIINE